MYITKFAISFSNQIDTALNYNKIRNKANQFKALTSFSVEEFDELLSLFSPEWHYFIEKFNLDGSPRPRKYTPRAEDQLATPAEKLFFILYFFKNNPLQEALAASFDLSQDMANKWVHIYDATGRKSHERLQNRAKRG